MYNGNGFISQDMRIELDKENVYLACRNRGKVSKKCPLKNLELILAIEGKTDFNLVLLFENDVQLMLLLETNEHRERLLSTIMTLRSFLQIDHN